MAPFQLHPIAYHEAGHAVVAHHLGYTRRAATIRPVAESLGQVWHLHPLRGIRLDIDGTVRARLRVEKAIMICLAGPRAQRRYRPSSHWKQWGSSDFQIAGDLATRVCGSAQQATAFLAWLDVVTREMVDLHWASIAGVAAALLERNKLNAADIIAAMRSGDGISA